MDKNLTSWIQITSGQGPDECCWVVARVVDDILKEALSNGYKARIVETTSGSKYDIFKSALIAIEGKDPSLFIAKWQGTIQWIDKSMFRPKHKRKNWFIGINSYQIPKIETIRDGDLKFDKMRSSGPGGQHVNKTESAIRVTHVPSGLTAIAQEERSQHLNRKLALVRLYERLNQEKETAKLKQQKEQWSNHSSLERGNPIRSYEGLNFKLKSSLR